jgi:hypothetical protein
MKMKNIGIYNYLRNIIKISHIHFSVCAVHIDNVYHIKEMSSYIIQKMIVDIITKHGNNLWEE